MQATISSYIYFMNVQNLKIQEAVSDARSAPFASTTPQSIGSLDALTELPVLV